MHLEEGMDIGRTITCLPLRRLSDSHISHHGRFGLLTLLIKAAHSADKLEIVFPSDREKAVSRTVQWGVRR